MVSSQVGLPIIAKVLQTVMCLMKGQKYHAAGTPHAPQYMKAICHPISCHSVCKPCRLHRTYRMGISSFEIWLLCP